MVDNSKIVLENGIEYTIIDKINQDEYSYVYLKNVKDKDDICIRKEVYEDDECFLVGLNSQEEFMKALQIFLDKIK